MPISSNPNAATLGLRTDLAIEHDRSIALEREEFVSVRTPSDRGYPFGNFPIRERCGHTIHQREGALWIAAR